MKKNLILLLSFVIGLLSLASCEETMEAPEYDNWQQRNNIFIDSIAEVARANDDGSWRVFLGESVDTLETANDFTSIARCLRVAAAQRTQTTTTRYLPIIADVSFRRAATAMAMCSTRHTMECLMQRSMFL